MLRRAAILTACAVALAGCASSRPPPPPIGASEFEVEADRYRVTYRGPSRMSDAEVHDRALLRAAEVTLARGYDWFSVIDRFNDVAAATSPRFSFGVGGGSFGRSSAVGLGAGTARGGEPSFVSALEIRLGRNPRPPTPDVYDASSVADTLRRRLS